MDSTVDNSEPSDQLGRLPLIGDDTTDPMLQSMFGRARGGFGFVPNLYRTLGHSPELLEAWLALAWPLRHASTTARSVRELVILRVAQIDGCDYEWAQHRPMAIESGVSERQVAHLSTWREHVDSFSEQEAAALAIAESVTGGGETSDADWSLLAEQFNTRECVEIVLTASFYACVSRVLTTLRVPLEQDEPETLDDAETSDEPDTTSPRS